MAAESLLEDHLQLNCEKGESTERGKPALKKRIGLFNGCAIIIGVIVGSGIFVSPKGILQECQSVGESLVLWLVCGLYSLLGALCYAELGTTIPVSGGDYTYINAAFGSLPAFLFLWIALIIVNPTSLAVIALTFANYLLQPFYGGETIPLTVVRGVAGTVIIGLTLLNCYNVRGATKAADACAVAKIGALLVIIVSAVVYVCRGHTENLQVDVLFKDAKVQPVEWALAFYSGVFSFSGWSYLNFVTEELKEPNKNLPRAIFISLPLCTLIYVLVNVAYASALTGPEILASDAVAVSFAAKAMGPAGFLVPIFVVLACLGSLNAIIFTCSRMFYAGAKNGHLPSLLGCIHATHLTPLPSILFMGFSSLIMLFASNIYALINYLTFAESSIVTMAVAGLIKIRITEPDRERPIKLPIVIPVVFFLICVYVLVTPFLQRPIELIVAAALITSGVPVYLFFIACRHKSSCLTRPWEWFTETVKQILNCVPVPDDDIST